jgi:PKHD-type hydroxylase
MQHVLPYGRAVEPWAWWEGAFSTQELDYLQEIAANATQLANVGGNITNVKDIRRSQVSWLEKNQETAWVFEKLSTVVSLLNSQYYRLDLTGFGEPLQMTNYDCSENGMYGWHQDFGANGVSRKLSVVLQLSDPSQYEGGNLQILTGEHPQTLRKQRGLIIAFPAYTLHQVTPVTQGSRQSLVAWVSGPEFR